MSTRGASTRVLGGVVASLVFAGSIHWQPAAAQRAALSGAEFDRDAQGRPILGHSWLCVKTSDDTVLVDPTAWRTGDVFGSLEIASARSFDTALASLDTALEDVTHVIVTHGHIDHVLGLTDGHGAPRFPNAEYHFPSADWSELVIDSGPMRSRLGSLDSAGQLRLTSGDVDICRGVKTLAAPGETAGHQVVEVVGADGVAYYVGDLVHFTFEFGEPGRSVTPVTEPAESADSRRRICDRIIERDGTLIFTHAPTPDWARLSRNGRGWRYEPAVVPTA